MPRKEEHLLVDNKIKIIKAHIEYPFDMVKLFITLGWCINTPSHYLPNSVAGEE
jgi:hypothetical protein